MYSNYSILMSVYDREKPEYLKRAIESMLNQTVPSDDFVIVCDGPLTPELNSVLITISENYSGLFHILRLKSKQGLGNALNSGLLACKNELVARMDSDDISFQNRCELQLKKFQSDSMLALCSGDIVEFETDENDRRNIRHVPSLHKEIVEFARKRNPMNHVAVMFKKSAVLEAGGYIEISLAEDYYLWVRMFQKGYKAANINQTLVAVRVGNGMYQRRGGLSYAKKIFMLQYQLKKMNFISCYEFLRNCALRVGICLIPSFVRRLIYQTILRD